MNKEQALEIISTLKKEISERSLNYKFLNPWFLTSGYDKVPVYKRIAFGYTVNDKDQYEIIVKIFSKNGKTRRFAREIIEKIGEGRVERIFSGKIRPVLLLGLDNKIKNNQPVSIGASVSNDHYNYGSIGGFVKNADGNELLLTCGHVLKDKKLNHVYSPALRRKISKSHYARKVGEIHHHHLPCINNPNLIDASTAIIYDHIETAKNTILHDCEFRGKTIKPIPNDFRIPPKGTIVYKLGVHHLFKIGSFIGLLDFHIGRHKFYDMYAINNKIGEFAAPGDSGSMVCIEQNGELLGLGIIVGQQPSEDDGGEACYQTFVCPLNRILETLKVSLI
jgi:hypothetical protein